MGKSRQVTTKHIRVLLRTTAKFFQWVFMEVCGPTYLGSSGNGGRAAASILENHVRDLKEPQEATLPTDTLFIVGKFDSVYVILLYVLFVWYTVWPRYVSQQSLKLLKAQELSFNCIIIMRNKKKLLSFGGKKSRILL